MIFSKLDLSKIANKLGKSSYSRGPKGYCVMDLLYAKIAMRIERIPTVKDLVRRLGKSLYSGTTAGLRFLEMSRLNLLSADSWISSLNPMSFQPCSEVVIQAKNLDIIDGRNTSLDSSKLFFLRSFCSKIQDATDDGTNPNWGMKRDTNGNNTVVRMEDPCTMWQQKRTPPRGFGHTGQCCRWNPGLAPHWKLKSPIYWLRIFKPKYYAMDSAYDFEANYRRIIEDHKGSPIIAYNPRGSKTPPEGMNDRFPANLLGRISADLLWRRWRLPEIQMPSRYRSLWLSLRQQLVLQLSKLWVYHED